jgi:hypothetical protein
MAAKEQERPVVPAPEPARPPVRVMESKTYPGVVWPL